jgi:phosphohistidine phosphatase
MDVLFIRHAEAEPHGAKADEKRALTADGRRQAKAVLAALEAMELRPQALLSSRLVRAWETAEPMAERWKLKIEPADELAPPGDAVALVKRLTAMAAKGVKLVALFGHAPSMDDMLAAVLGCGRPVGSLQKGGMALVRLEVGKGEPELRWMLRRDQIDRIGR